MVFRLDWQKGLGNFHFLLGIFGLLFLFYVTQQWMAAQARRVWKTGSNGTIGVGIKDGIKTGRLVADRVRNRTLDSLV